MLKKSAGCGSRWRLGPQRTWNMPCMSVTPEVFQLEMSASKNCKPWKRSLMSEMAETSQSAMGPYLAIAYSAVIIVPYLAIAYAWSSLYDWTAVFREAFVVNL